MIALAGNGTDSAIGRPTRARGPLWLSLPIALGDLSASAAGIFTAFPYAAETASWAAQGRGQDVVNLAAFVGLLIAAAKAGRGSLREYLVWLGLVAYSAYSYLIYAGFLHFGPVFPIYVATFGLSVYGLAWGFLVLDPHRLRALFKGGPVRTTSAFMITVAALFYALELSTDLMAIAAGTLPASLTEVGLFVDPIHVLDMGLVLPAMLVAGIALWQRRPLGFVLAPPLLAFLGTLTVAIGGMFISLSVSGVPIVLPMLGVFGVSALISFVLLLALLKSLPQDAWLADALKGSRP